MSSQSQQISTTNIPREQHAALFSVINKSRMQNGWQTKTAAELDATIRTWAEAFAFKKIPADPAIYQELYLRAFEVRVDAQQQGKDVPQCDAVLLASCWVGLKHDIEQKRILAGRTLTQNAASDCRHCHGTGRREVVVGGVKGRGGICDHTDIEPLFGEGK